MTHQPDDVGQLSRALFRTVGLILVSHSLFRFLRQFKVITLVCALVISYYLIIGNIQNFTDRTQYVLLLLLATSLAAHLAALFYLLALLLVHRIRIKQRSIAVFRRRILSWSIETIGTFFFIVLVAVLQAVIHFE